MMTPLNRSGLPVLLVMLAACTSHERWFEPSCMAYEGDRVMLRGNRFEWRKFSDQVPMGADGAPADPLPAYPMSGTYRQERDRVEFNPDDGSRIDDHFIVDHLGNRYLLTQQQHQQFVDDKVLNTCALRLITVE